MPPLGLLSVLARTRNGDAVSSEDAGRAIALADRLASEMPRMLAEHQVIVGLVEELRTAEGVAAAVAAGAIQRIFALHLDKENRLLMPFIIQSPGLSLAQAVEGLHELVGEGAAHHHGDGQHSH